MIYKISDEILATRKELAEHTEMIIQELGNLPDGESIILDFSSVRFVALSVTNLIIFLWKRVIGGEFGEKFMALHGLSEDVAAGFQTCLHDAHSVMIVSNSIPKPIGYIESVNEETWNYVSNNNGVSAVDMQNEFPDLKIHACSTRLKRLYDKRLIRRVKRDGSYKYCPISYE